MVGFWKSAFLLVSLPAAFAENLVRFSAVEHFEAAVQALESGQLPVLFEKVDLEHVQNIVHKANFVSYPKEHREMLMMHKVVHPLTGNKKYRVRDVGTYELSGIQGSSDGTVKELTLPPETVSEDTRKKFLDDAAEYAQFCGSLQTVEEYEECEKYLEKWRLDNDLPATSQAGMLPTNQYSCWGDIDKLTYMSSSTYGFQAMIPSNLWVYAVGDSSNNKLQHLEAYSIASGIHTVQPKCNAWGCRSYFKREMWGRIKMTPYASHNQNTFHWKFSRPNTKSGGHDVSTTIDESFDMGVSGKYTNNGTSEGYEIEFSATWSWTSTYSETTTTLDFSVLENTVSSTAEGKWNYYQTYPVNIHTHPLSNFGSDWPAWYDPDWCTVVSGPDLARSSHQTSNAVKWWIAPSMINYSAKSLWVTYSVQYDDEIDAIWCEQWTGSPANPCNVNGEHHHCYQSLMAKMYPSWGVNLVQSLNNLS